MKIILIGTIVFGSVLCQAQTVGINSTGAVPATSAMLDVSSVNKGVLIPRVDITDLSTAAPVSSPVSSLLVYNVNTTTGKGYYYWDGTKWVKLVDTNSNSDEDWYKATLTTAPTSINDAIYTNGKVGVGINNPQSGLEVSIGANSTNSSVAIEGYGTSRPGINALLNGSDFGGLVQGGTNGHLVLGIRENELGDGLLITSGGGNYNADQTYDTPILFARADGKIGIGNVAPNEKLDVSGNIQMHNYSLGVGNGIFFRNGFNSAINPYNLSITTDNFSGDGTPDALSINAYEGVSISTGHNTQLQRRLTVTNNGNVGIGTIAPEGALHVVSSLQNNSFSDGIGFLKGSGGNDYQLQINAVGGVPHIDLANSANEDYDIRLAVYSDDKLSIQGGNVGIGTINPTSMLQLENGSLLMNGNVAQILLKASASSIDPGDIIFVNGDGTNKARIWSDPSNVQGLQINGSGDAVAHLKIQGNGDVGIGMTPAHKFEVSVDDAAKPSTNTWTVPSDRRLKENIKPYEGGLQEVLAIKPIWFTYTGKAGMPKDTGVGVIAQELQKIAPYMVGDWEYNNNETKETYLSVNNGAMTYMLINAVKELKAENDLLKKRIEKLESKQ